MTYDFAKPPFRDQKQEPPGQTDAMDPRPDHGEDSYRGAGGWQTSGQSSPVPTVASDAPLRSPMRAREPMS